MTAQQFKGQATVNTTLVTTAETVVATVSGVSTGRALNVQVRGWAQLTTGTNTTAVTPRIRRGTTVSGTLIDEGNPITIGAAAGSTEDFDIDVTDEGADLASASYVLTLEQTGASANGTCLQAGIEAYVPE